MGRRSNFQASKADSGVILYSVYRIIIDIIYLTQAQNERKLDIMDVRRHAQNFGRGETMGTNGECTRVRWTHAIKAQAQDKPKARQSDVNYRSIARWLASGIPERLSSFEENTNRYLAMIRELTEEHKIALRSAFIFSHKVPREEREDLFQELASTLCEKSVKDEKLAYSIARCDWANWWAKYRIRAHLSLDSVANDDDGNETTLADTLVGEAEWALKQDDRLDANALWSKLPKNIRPLVQKRLYGKALTATERQTMSRFVRGQGVTLLMS